jgi:uncharacterized tellurite resistance protein B-like protein
MRPILFETLSKNQRLSIINFHVAVGLSDGKINSQEEDILEKLLNLCGVHINECMEYFEHEGKNEQLVLDLVSLQAFMKKIIVVSIWDLIICDGKPNENELSVAFTILNKLGINENRFYEIIEDKEKIMRHFGY